MLGEMDLVSDVSSNDTMRQDQVLLKTAPNILIAKNQKTLVYLESSPNALVVKLVDTLS